LQYIKAFPREQTAMLAFDKEFACLAKIILVILAAREANRPAGVFNERCRPSNSPSAIAFIPLALRSHALV
jgi:hypothetical protein